VRTRKNGLGLGLGGHSGVRPLGKSGLESGCLVPMEHALGHRAIEHAASVDDCGLRLLAVASGNNGSYCTKRIARLSANHSIMYTTLLLRPRSPYN